ncbi:hypothetical protein FA13DRAFT_1707914 [Coprinellus micaceus]|uniref:Uncharacterized protein n=1 Tax=Coprinellus micaceus TaxID=71717 RepID=A0A4Y7TJT6_COPMI|nr:hypothetical protein FA13DRAFT_1707914 [Coprinellus micaceus]
MEFIGNGERGGRPIYEGVEVSPRAQECGEAAGNSTGPGVDEGRWTWRQHRGLGEEGHDTCGVTNGREPMVQGKPYRLKKTVSTNIRSFLVTISRVREVGEKREGVMSTVQCVSGADLSNKRPSTVDTHTRNDEYSFEVSNTPPVFLKSPATDKGPGFALAVFGPVGCTIDARRPKAYGRGNMPRGASVHTRRFQKQHWLEYRYESDEAAWAPRRQTYRQGSAAAAPDARIDLGRLTLTLFPEAQRIPLTQENPSIVRVPSRLSEAFKSKCITRQWVVLQKDARSAGWNVALYVVCGDGDQWAALTTPSLTFRLPLLRLSGQIWLMGLVWVILVADLANRPYGSHLSLTSPIWAMIAAGQPIWAINSKRRENHVA